jgi:peptide/nickel transport system substrate-binding protein
MCASLALALVAACDPSASGTPVAERTSTVAPPTVEPTDKPGGTLRIAGSSMVSGDPGWATSIAQRLLARMVSRQLYAYPASADAAVRVAVVPDLAAAPPVVTDGGRTYRVMIKLSARWDVPNGRRVTATDAARGIKRLCTPPRPSPMRAYFAATIVGFNTYCSTLLRTPRARVRQFIEGHEISGVEVVGDSTIVFHLLRPANDFTDVLALPAASPVPAEMLDYEPDSSAYRSNLISDGPYKFTDARAGESFRLSRNPAWDAGSDPVRHALVDHVTLRLGLSAADVEREIERDRADMAWDTAVPPDRLTALSQAQDLRLTTPPQGGLVSLVYGMRGPARTTIDRPGVRRALAYCLDKQAVVRALGGTVVATTTGQLLQSSMIGYEPRDEYPTVGSAGDAPRCRAGLVAAGFRGPIRLSMITADTPQDRAVAEAVRRSMAAAGVTVTVAAVPTQQYQRQLVSPSRQTWDLAVAASDPDWFGNAGRTVFGPLVDGRWPAPKAADGGFRSASFTAAYDRALGESDPNPDVRADRWGSVEKLVLRDAPLAPLAVVVTPRLHSTNVRNVAVVPSLGDADPTNVSLGVT